VYADFLDALSPARRVHRQQEDKHLVAALRRVAEGGGQRLQYDAKVQAVLHLQGLGRGGTVLPSNRPILQTFTRTRAACELLPARIDSALCAFFVVLT